MVWPELDRLIQGVSPVSQGLRGEPKHKVQVEREASLPGPYQQRAAASRGQRDGEPVAGEGKYRQGDGYVDYSTVPEDQRRELADAVNALARTLLVPAQRGLCVLGPAEIRDVRLPGAAAA